MMHTDIIEKYDDVLHFPKVMVTMATLRSDPSIKRHHPFTMTLAIIDTMTYEIFTEGVITARPEEAVFLYRDENKTLFDILMKKLLNHQRSEYMFHANVFICPC